MDDYRTIDGWFSERDAHFYTYQVQRASDSARFVEIGSWKGRSSFCMANAIRESGKAIEFCCVDTWEGSVEHEQNDSIKTGTLYDEFLRNIAPVRDFLTPIRASSLEAAERFDDGSLDLVFIDAAHDYDNVLADIEAWRPKVKPGGVLAGHDYLEDLWPGVVQAVARAFQGKERVYGTCWYFASNARAAPHSMREFRKHLRRQWHCLTSSRPHSRQAA